MNLQPTTLIFSAELEGKSLGENSLRTHRLANMLLELGLDYKQIIGCYRYDSGNTSQETSFVLPLNDQELKDTLVGMLLEKFGQESVLELSPGRQAFLIRKDSEQYIGKWTNVSEKVALAQDAYSYDESTGEYYAVV